MKKELGSETLMIQFKKSIEYLKTNKKFDDKFGVDSVVRTGWGYDTFLFQYLSTKLKVEELDLLKQDKETLRKLEEPLEHLGYYDTLSIIPSNVYKSNKRSKWTVLISKYDKESLLLHLTYRKNPKVHGQGYIYMFFFDNNNEIVKFFETSWIE